jgi:hypothetical protein
VQKAVFHRFAPLDKSLMHFELLVATNNKEYA